MIQNNAIMFYKKTVLLWREKDGARIVRPFLMHGRMRKPGSEQAGYRAGGLLGVLNMHRH